MNHHSGKPARNITTTPPNAIATEVPRSGCNNTKPIGSAISIPDGTAERQVPIKPFGSVS